MTENIMCLRSNEINLGHNLTKGLADARVIILGERHGHSSSKIFGQLLLNHFNPKDDYLLTEGHPAEYGAAWWTRAVQVRVYGNCKDWDVEPACFFFAQTRVGDIERVTIDDKATLCL